MYQHRKKIRKIIILILVIILLIIASILSVSEHVKTLEEDNIIGRYT